jgi:hypothetical protein
LDGTLTPYNPARKFAADVSSDFDKPLGGIMP